MDDALDEIAYVARSPNRVAVLAALEEAPRTRRNLGDLTGASRATLARVLGELEVRRWIERSGDHYLATDLGQLVSAEVASLVETMETVGSLREVAHLLPTDGDLEVLSFADAAITRPDSTEPTAHMDRAFDHVATAARVHVLANTAIPRLVLEAADRLAEEDFWFTATVPDAFVRGLDDDSTVLPGFRDIVARGGAVRLASGRIEHNVAIADDTVILWLCDDRGTNQGLCVTDGPDIREWATATIERHDEDATPLDEAVPIPGEE